MSSKAKILHNIQTHKHSVSCKKLHYNVGSNNQRLPKSNLQLENPKPLNLLPIILKANKLKLKLHLLPW